MAFGELRGGWMFLCSRAARRGDDPWREAGGEENLKLREKIADAVRSNPVFSKKGHYFKERADLYKSTLQKYLALPALAMSLGEKDPIAVGRVIRELIDEPGGLDLHLGMFIPTVQGQGDDEQRKHWLPMCQKLQIIGTYAQTELGHGTYIRGLETTATYDPEKEEFVVHSPTLTATKWWPGGMGKTSTHAVVMARLITRGEDKGPHAFIVQIRRNEDHQDMPGVTAGDIGPKMGYNAVDNGFLRFDHVRVPRRAMLMRHSRVDPDGTYHPPPVAKASYGTMVFVRSDIVMNAALYMKKAGRGGKYRADGYASAALPRRSRVSLVASSARPLENENESTDERDDRRRRRADTSGDGCVKGSTSGEHAGNTHGSLSKGGEDRDPLQTGQASV